MSFLKKIVTSPNGILDITLEKNDVRRGESLKGILSFSAMESFLSNMVRCEVECLELFQHMQTGDSMQPQMVADTRVVYSITQQLQGQTHYKKGQKISLPFEVPIPADSFPSLKSDAVNDIWNVKGVVAVHRRPDVTTTAQFQVLSQ